MEKIEKIIDTFLEPYKTDADIQAAMLYGSYAQGNQNKYSDIDIFIVSSDNLNWREQGSKIISNYTFEYFINPSKIIIREIEEYNLIWIISIILNGKEIFDKTGILKQLKEKAQINLKKPTNPVNSFEIEMIKYSTFHNYDQLKRAFEYNMDEFMYLYYILLDHIIYSYGKINGIHLPPKTKIYQYIMDENYYLCKELMKINDYEFLNKLKVCMKKSDYDLMYKNITELYGYFLSSIGGFNIDGWKIRGEIK